MAIVVMPLPKMGEKKLVVAMALPKQGYKFLAIVEMPLPKMGGKKIVVAKITCEELKKKKCYIYNIFTTFSQQITDN